MVRSQDRVIAQNPSVRPELLVTGTWGTWRRPDGPVLENGNMMRWAKSTNKFAIPKNSPKIPKIMIPVPSLHFLLGYLDSDKNHHILWGLPPEKTKGQGK